MPYFSLQECLINQADEAAKGGEWSLEIDLLTKLKEFVQADTDAETLKEQIESALHDIMINQKFVWMYNNAIQLVKDGNYEAAKTLLQDLWVQAPRYGDPAGLAKKLGLRVPKRRSISIF